MRRRRSARPTGHSGTNEGNARIRQVAIPADHPRRLAHPRQVSAGEHLLIAERAYGKCLPRQAVVHHVNQNPGDNRHQNLVICEDRGYHALLHARQRVVDAGGDPNVQAVCIDGHLRDKDEKFCLVCRKAYTVQFESELQEFSLSLSRTEQLFLVERMDTDCSEMDFSEIRELMFWYRKYSQNVFRLKARAYFLSERTCSVPFCRISRIYARGMCNGHFNEAALLVRSGRTTWEELVSKGKVLAAKHDLAQPSMLAMLPIYETLPVGDIKSA